VRELTLVGDATQCSLVVVLPRARSLLERIAVEEGDDNPVKLIVDQEFQQPACGRDAGEAMFILSLGKKF